MDDVKRVVGAATSFLRDVVADASGIRVEEAEREGDDWLITVSYLAPADGPLAGLQTLVPLRLYRRFRVSGGAVVSMKIRETEDA